VWRRISRGATEEPAAGGNAARVANAPGIGLDIGRVTPQEIRVSSCGALIAVENNGKITRHDAEWRQPPWRAETQSLKSEGPKSEVSKCLS